MYFTNEEQVKSRVDETVKKIGRINTVINNTGIQIISPIVDFSVSAWRKLFDIIRYLFSNSSSYETYD
ncbi:SDR family NAD(P)-dependent oxidoreductase [Francisella persica]|uniref:SDR family NAD(P)-dependent oxidoreductase n=1 Tax=Francisella persica TaxID=954 RepID=UPI000ABF65D4|nr:SDR family NAD(P)-dependent oxidoreductase [Francisella persica]